MSQEHLTVGQEHSSEFSESWHVAAVASRNLESVIAEVYSLARMVKAGKVPSPKQIKRIGQDLSKYRFHLDCAAVQVVSHAFNILNQG